MSDDTNLRQALRGPAKLSRRERRAIVTRAKALSPLRILLQVLLVPVVTVALTVSIYIRTSPYERTDALRHLAALAGCDTARSMGLAPAYEGQLGYHARNDKDGDGVACGEAVIVSSVLPEIPAMSAGAVDDPGTHRVSGAKFVKP